MDQKDNRERFVLFDSRPTGEAVNPHVFRIAPQRQLDYSAIQRLIKESAQLISVKTSEE